MTHRRTNPQTFSNSRLLRDDQTEAEARLWGVLRMHQVEDIHFRRQHAIGHYVVDFCAPRYKIIIELDGSQHLDQKEYDEERSVFLESKGDQVLRFWNDEVFQNMDNIIKIILATIAAKPK